MLMLFIFILGLAAGSFINALVWRVHQLSKTKSAKKRQELSITRGRSMCPHCRHALSIRDLVPVLSYLALAGKCRYCQKPIGWQYPVVELATGLLFAISFGLWPYGFGEVGALVFIAWLLLLVGLIALAVYDLRWMLLPNVILYPLFSVWLVAIAVQLIGGASWHILIEAGLGVVFCGGIFWLLFQLSKGAWIGGGDVKLGFLLGFVVGGPLAALMVIFIASLLGTVYVIPSLLNKKLGRSSRIPFGPFLILAAIIVFLAGSEWSAALEDYLLFA